MAVAAPTTVLSVPNRGPHAAMAVTGLRHPTEFPHSRTTLWHRSCSARAGPRRPDESPSATSTIGRITRPRCRIAAPKTARPGAQALPCQHRERECASSRPRANGRRGNPCAEVAAVRDRDGADGERSRVAGCPLPVPAALSLARPPLPRNRGRAAREAEDEGTKPATRSSRRVPRRSRAPARCRDQRADARLPAMAPLTRASAKAAEGAGRRDSWRRR
jgi:hypothetical protein